MKILIDFTLNDNIDLVGQTIFRLVLNGVCNTLEIADYLRLYSDEVISNSIRKLVNGQILTVDLNKRELQLAPPITALMEQCFDQTYDINLPPIFQEYIMDSKMILGEINDNTECRAKYRQIKQEIIRELLPNIDMGFLLNYIDFAIETME